MSTKMSVRYGVDAKPISEMGPVDTLVCFRIMDGGKVLLTDEYDFDDLPHENQQRVSLYGLNKLLTDRTSDEKDKLVKLGKMQAVFDLLVSGEWAKERTVGAIVVSAAVEALAAMQSMSIADTQAALAQYDKDTRKAILGRKDVLEAATKISAERKDAPRKTLDDMIPEKA